MKRGSPTGFEVRIRFIVMFFSYLVWLFLECSGSALRSSAVKPVRETGGAEQRVIGRDEAALLKRRAEVDGLLVPHDCAGIVMRHEVLAHDLVNRESVGAGHSHGPI